MNSRASTVQMGNSKFFVVFAVSIDEFGGENVITFHPEEEKKNPTKFSRDV